MPYPIVLQVLLQRKNLLPYLPPINFYDANDSLYYRDSVVDADISDVVKQALRFGLTVHIATKGGEPDDYIVKKAAKELSAIRDSNLSIWISYSFYSYRLVNVLLKEDRGNIEKELGAFKERYMRTVTDFIDMFKNNQDIKIVVMRDELRLVKKFNWSSEQIEEFLSSTPEVFRGIDRIQDECLEELTVRIKNEYGIDPKRYLADNYINWKSSERSRGFHDRILKLESGRNEKVREIAESI